MPQQDGRTHLPRGRAWGEPSWRLHIRWHLDGPVGVQAQLGDPYREADGGDPNGDWDGTGDDRGGRDGRCGHPLSVR